MVLVSDVASQLDCWKLELGPFLMFWCLSFVISVFAIVILSVLGLLFRGNHPELVGGVEDPEDGPAVAATVFTAVIIYAVCRANPASTRLPIIGNREYVRTRG